MLQGVSEAYVAAKRVQAQIPLLMKVPDVEKAREQYRGSRLANLLMGPQSEISVMQWKFDGADYQAFTDTELRSICAAMGIPWELVLNDHSAKSGASARSMWQSFYQQADEWQLDHAEQTSRPIDESIIRERQITDPIPGLTDDWHRNMAGVYQQPERITPDPLKEAQAAETWDRLNRSRSSAFADQGWDYREEVMQKSQDTALDEAQGVDPEPESPEPMPAEPSEDPADESDQEDPEDAPAPPQAAMAADIHARQVELAKAGATQIVIHQPASILHATLPSGPPPVVNVTAQAAPAAVTVAAAAPAIHVHAAEQPAAQVTVNVPQQAAPIVMATASAPAVHVHVPEPKSRKQRAVEQKDGSVILEDIE
jgi:hypothetical protein